MVSYADEIEGRLATEGFQKAPEKRNMDHYTWLARFQLGESRRAIAASLPDGASKSSDRTVAMAINNAAKGIGLTLRDQ